MGHNARTLGGTALAALIALATAGCYRATGYDRATLIAEEMPAIGGDRVTGLKSAAGAGDYYIGNDFVGLAVDGTPAREGAGTAGAPGGGSIIDVGFVMLDSSFRRAPAPCDMLDRMTTVANQDPDISLVAHSFRATMGAGAARIEMEGRLHDPMHRIPGASWDVDGFALDIRATTSIALGPLDRHFALETTITNDGPSAVGIRNIGDFVFQRGGGFRVLAPVHGDFSGNHISATGTSWGVDIPGTDFSDPLQNSVQSGPVVLMGTEPGSDTLDCHVSLGLMPLDFDALLVASDPQKSLTEHRPAFPERFVAGGMAADGPLEPGEAITHRRRLYVKGGASGAMEYIITASTQGTPNQGTGILNDMCRDALSLKGKSTALLRFLLEGTGSRSCPVPSELRFERYTGEDDPTIDQDPLSWRLERLEWMEPADSTEYMVSSSTGQALGSTPDTSFGVLLPEGAYRIVSRSHSHETTLQEGTDMGSSERPNTPAAIALEGGKAFSLLEAISPERSEIYSTYGSRVSNAVASYAIATRGNDSQAGFVQPMRFAFLGRDGAAGPDFMRKRSITSTFDANTRKPKTPGPPLTPTSLPPGQFHFMGGDQAFGVQMSTQSTPLILSMPPGIYDAYGARGPLSTLERFAVDARPGLGDTGRLLTVFQSPPPKGWLAFDAPGPSMATTGGALPCEQLASALAEGVDIVGMVETDHQRDAAALYLEFKASLGYKTDLNQAVGVFPLAVGGRQSSLAGFGTATALFTPADQDARRGGARLSDGWTLADFLAQAEGGFNVSNRPRGPQGLFTQKGFDPALPLPLAAPWWQEAGPLSLGMVNGDFDALEILSAGALAESGPSAWWQEFRAARADWFSMIAQQEPASFTKAIGLSSGRFSQDTPAGLVRTWLYVGDADMGQGAEVSTLGAAETETALAAVLDALRRGAAVVSSGPLLIARVGGAGPGDVANLGGSPQSVTLDVTLVAPDWVPVDEIRVTVNGRAAATLADPKGALAWSAEDSRVYTGTMAVPVPAGGDAWLVAEAGAPLDASAPYRPEEEGWNAMMKGIYPVAVANPIFLDLDGGGYEPPGIQ
jgi:hypothetical protein